MFTFELDITSGFQMATYPAGATFGPRLLRDYELVWIIEGDARYQVEDREWAAPQGSIVLCKPETIDFFQWDTRRRTRHGWFHFHLQGETPSEWNRPMDWDPVRTPAAETDLLTALFRRLIAGGPDRGNAVISAASRILATALLAAFIETPSHSTGTEDATYPDPVERAMTYIATQLEENAAAPLLLKQIADIACVTPEHLCRLFKAHTGHSPAETVRLLRLDRAAVLLVRTNYSVGEIAQLCGFSSQFHFARRFKEVFGQPPTELRRDISAGRGMIPTTRLIRFRRSLSR